MTDFLDEKRKEIQARLKELKPLVEEYQRLEAAERALAGRERYPRPGRLRTCRCAPLALHIVLGAAAAGAGADRRAPAPAPCRRSSWSARAPASPSPSWPRRWASSRTTSTG